MRAKPDVPGTGGALVGRKVEGRQADSRWDRVSQPAIRAGHQFTVCAFCDQVDYFRMRRPQKPVLGASSAGDVADCCTIGEEGENNAARVTRLPEGTRRLSLGHR